MVSSADARDYRRSTNQMAAFLASFPQARATDGGNMQCVAAGLRPDRRPGLGPGPRPLLQRRPERRRLPARPCGRGLAAFPKRRGIGGMALHASGGIVVGGRDIAYVSLTTARPRLLLLARRHSRRHRLQRSDHRRRRSHLCRLAGLPRLRRRDAEARPSACHRPRWLDAHPVRWRDADQRPGFLAGRQAPLSL